MAGITEIVINLGALGDAGHTAVTTPPALPLTREQASALLTLAGAGTGFAAKMPQRLSEKGLSDFSQL
jgi:hypothetical protein